MFPDVNKVLLGLQAAIFVPDFTLLYSNTRYDYTHDTRTIVEEYKNTGAYAAIQKYTTLLTVYSIQYTEHRTHLDDRDDYDDNLPPTPSTTPPPPPSKHWHQRSPVPSYPPNRSLPTHPSNTTSNASNTSTSTSNASIPSSFLPLLPSHHARPMPSFHAPPSDHNDDFPQTNTRPIPSYANTAPYSSTTPS